MKDLNKQIFLISSILLCLSCWSCTSPYQKEDVLSIEVHAPQTSEYLKTFDESTVELTVTYKDQNKQTFKGKDLTKVETHSINYGHIVENDKIVDEVLVSIFLKPKTYTKEDLIEINTHGGISVTNKILELLLENGARLAEPGEFTKRAFLNGRIDLLEAESVMDLIKVPLLEYSASTVIWLGFVAVPTLIFVLLPYLSYTKEYTVPVGVVAFVTLW